MHILTITETIKPRPNFVIPPGDYLAEDVNAAQLLLLADGGKMTPLHPEVLAVQKKFDPAQDWNGKSILVVRTGGFGDLVLMTPVLRELKRRWPTLKINLSCFPDYAPVLENLPFVDALVQYPVPMMEANQYDAWVIMENAIEKNEEAKKTHMTDLFAERFGIDAKEKYDKHPEYRVTEREAIWAQEAYPRKKGIQRLCVQFAAQVENRTYPGQRMQSVVEHFHRKGWEVFVMGKPGELKMEENDTLRNLTAHGTTMRQSCAVLATADCVLGPDSALVHLAGALDVPTVALYGPFPAELRVAYSPSIQVLEGSGHCAPCFHHVRRGQSFPAHGPCFSKKYCTVLDSIPIKKVIDRVTMSAKKLFD
jgi:ADP-heptose:LPS heptosyltransferase